MQKIKLNLFLLSVIFLITSCSKSMQEKLIGEWKFENEQQKLFFFENGDYLLGNGEKGKWEIINKEPIIVKLNSSDREPDHFRLSFINDDIISFKMVENSSEKYKLVRITKTNSDTTLSYEKIPKKKFINSYHQESIDAVENILRSAVVLQASDNLLETGEYKYPKPEKVSIKNMIENGYIPGWKDNGNGVWTYLATTTSLIYEQQKGGDGYKITQSNQ